MSRETPAGGRGVVSGSVWELDDISIGWKSIALELRSIWFACRSWAGVSSVGLRRWKDVLLECLARSFCLIGIVQEGVRDAEPASRLAALGLAVERWLLDLLIPSA